MMCHCDIRLWPYDV